MTTSLTNSAVWRSTPALSDAGYYNFTLWLAMSERRLSHPLGPLWVLSQELQHTHYIPIIYDHIFWGHDWHLHRDLPKISLSSPINLNITSSCPLHPGASSWVASTLNLRSAVPHSEDKIPGLHCHPCGIQWLLPRLALSVSWPTLTTSMQSWAFLGFTNFIADSLLGFWMSSPDLPHLQGHHTPSLGPWHTEVFWAPQMCLYAGPILAHFNPENPSLLKLTLMIMWLWQSYPRALPIDGNIHSIMFYPMQHAATSSTKTSMTRSS